MRSYVIAHLALVLFLPVAIVAFARLPRASAAAAVVLGGSLFLPERIAWNFPLIPPLDKEYVTYLCCFVGACLYRRSSLAAARPGRGPEALLLLSFLANVVTALTNTEPMWDEDKLEPGRDVWAVIAQTGDDFLGIALPFFVGRALFTRREDLRTLSTFLVAAGLVYTVLIVVEIVMSIPFHVFQLHMLVYGIPLRPQWRWGGIQPVVFMDNGLAVATLMAGSLIAATGVARSARARLRSGALSSASLWLGLLMTRNIAGNVYGAALALAALLVRPRVLARIVLSMAVLVASYPAMRMLDLFPHEALVELASRFDTERARSLEGRFDEEEHVLEAIEDRVWAGWGTYDRIPGAETFGSGEVGLDSWWIIRLGTNGIIGLELQFAFLVWPVVSAWRRIGRLPRGDAFLLAALMAIVGMRGIDLLVNGLWNYLPFFLAGTLYGLSRSPSASRAPAAPPPRKPALAPADAREEAPETAS